MAKKIPHNKEKKDWINYYFLKKEIGVLRPRIRMLVYKRDNFACQECGIKMSKETGAFHIHHKIPFLISFDNSPKNLITLYPSCHRRIKPQIIRKLKLQKGGL